MIHDRYFTQAINQESRSKKQLETFPDCSVSFMVMMNIISLINGLELRN